MNVYALDIKLCGTAYVRAESEEDAKRKLDEQLGPGSTIDLEANNIISGRGYDDPNLPEVSLSPALTSYGPWDGDTVIEHITDLNDDSRNVK